MSEIDDHEAIRAKFPEFLLAEHEHTAESLLRNEESGEKRATFFVSIAGASAAVLAFAFGDTSIVPRERVPAAAAGAATFLLILGLLTMRRIIERHIVTDRYIFALRSLRRAFLTREDAREFPNAFFKLYEVFEPRAVSIFGFGKGGWLETIALINAVLASVSAATAARAMSSAWPSFWPALVAFATAWTGQLSYARQKLARNAAELMACESRNVRK